MDLPNSRITQRPINRQVDSPSNASNRNCTECKKKPPQVQCLHCSEQVCLECAQKHVNLVGEESDAVTHLLNEKLDVLDRIAVNTRQKISAEHNKIVERANAERDQSFVLLAQMIEEEKQQLWNKNTQLNELPLNEIPTFIQRLKSDLRYLTDKNNRLFNVSNTAPKIVLQRHNQRYNKQTNSINLYSEYYKDDDY